MALIRKVNIESKAVFSEDGLHRFLLSRTWDHKGKRVTVIMLNPSFADEIKIDTTVMKVGNFLADHNFGSLQIVNLYSYISTNPKDLANNKDVIRKETDIYIKEAVQHADHIIIGWGSDSKKYSKRKKEVVNILSEFKCDLKCFTDKDNRKGRHPSRLGKDLILGDFI